MTVLVPSRRLLLVALVVGSLGIAGPTSTYGRFVDSHAGTGTYAAANDFPTTGGGPTADAGGRYEVYEGNSVQLDGTGSTVTGTADSYEWQILSGPGSLSGASTVEPTYNAPADVSSDTTVTVELTVTNWDQSDSDQTAITVRDAGSGNQDPLARFSADRSGNSDNVQLDATGSSDPEGASLTYDWDINGDGRYELRNASPTQKQKIPSGTDVTLRVTDDAGNTDTVTKTV